MFLLNASHPEQNTGLLAGRLQTLRRAGEPAVDSRHARSMRAPPPERLPDPARGVGAGQGAPEVGAPGPGSWRAAAAGSRRRLEAPRAPRL